MYIRHLIFRQLLQEIATHHSTGSTQVLIKIFSVEYFVDDFFQSGFFTKFSVVFQEEQDKNRPKILLRFLKVRELLGFDCFEK